MYAKVKLLGVGVEIRERPPDENFSHFTLLWKPHPVYTCLQNGKHEERTGCTAKRRVANNKNVLVSVVYMVCRENGNMRQQKIPQDQT